VLEVAVSASQIVSAKLVVMTDVEEAAEHAQGGNNALAVFAAVTNVRPGQPTVKV